MPVERMPMRQVCDWVRLKDAGMSIREIARRVGVASSTVRLTVRRCEAAGIAWLPSKSAMTGQQESLVSQCLGLIRRSEAVEPTFMLVIC